MFELSFMRNAFMAGTFIAIVSGTIGVFVMARSMSFLTHTLSEIGFAGASFAVFAGWPALNGMLLFTMLSSVLVGQMSIKESRREAVISAVSALFIGLGILFLSLSSQTASSATSILFGSVVGISRQEVWQLVGLSLLVMVVVMIGYRQLKFDSFDAVGARVNGINSTLISVVFLLLLALSVSVAADLYSADAACCQCQVFYAWRGQDDRFSNPVCHAGNLARIVSGIFDQLAGEFLYCSD